MRYIIAAVIGWTILYALFLAGWRLALPPCDPPYVGLCEAARVVK